jgi:hypothetical protein
VVLIRRRGKMSKFKVRTYFKEVYENIIIAGSRKEAEKLALDYLGTSIDSSWEDSKSEEINDDSEADNEA